MEHAPSVLLFRGRGFISSLIRLQTRSKYSHAAILMPDGRIIESWQGSGVRITTLKDWRGVDRFVIPTMSSEQWDSAIRFMLGQVGRGYDYLDVLRFVSRQRSSLNDRWFCSELVFAALSYAGVNLLERIEAWEVSPGLLSISPKLIEYDHITQSNDTKRKAICTSDD